MGSGSGPSQCPPNLLNPCHINFEEFRLHTFNTWSLQAPIPADRLAKAGFYYLGSGLEVICAFCNGRISDWEYGDIAIKKHALRFPNCVFVRNESNNVPLSKSIGRVRDEPTITVPSVSTPADITLDSPLVESQEEFRYPEQQVPRIILTNGRMRPIAPEIVANSDMQTKLLLQRMRSEQERFNSFLGKWPLFHISPNELARVGFFYLQQGDKVQCAFCQGVLRNWERGDQPYREHINNFPLCPFLLGRNVGNIPMQGIDVTGYNQEKRMPPTSGPENRSTRHTPDDLEEIGVNLHEAPKHPSQASIDARTRSFLSWPQGAAVRPDELTEAGFFYIGINDNVKCFSCDGGLCNWETGDIPWEEHARWFPSCSYLKLNKGGRYIREIQEKYENSNRVTSQIHGFPTLPLSPQLSPIIPLSTITSTPVPSAPTVIVRRSPNTSEQSSPIHSQSPSVRTVSGTSCSSNLDEVVESTMQSSMVQAVLRAGLYPPHLVRLAILRKFQMTGTGVQNLDELSEAVHKAKWFGQNQDKPSGGTTLSTETVIVSNNPGEDVTSKAEIKLNIPNGLETETNSSIEEENRQLKEQRLCKICMDKEVGVVFLPCGHLIACVQCAPALKDCAFCRTTIKGTIRAYMP